MRAHTHSHSNSFHSFERIYEVALCSVPGTMGVSGALNEFSETTKIGLRQFQIIRYNVIFEFHSLNAGRVRAKR